MRQIVCILWHCCNSQRGAENPEGNIRKCRGMLLAIQCWGAPPNPMVTFWGVGFEIQLDLELDWGPQSNWILHAKSNEIAFPIQLDLVLDWGPQSNYNSNWIERSIQSQIQLDFHRVWIGFGDYNSNWISAPNPTPNPIGFGIGFGVPIQLEL